MRRHRHRQSSLKYPPRMMPSANIFYRALASPRKALARVSSTSSNNNNNSNGAENQRGQGNVLTRQESLYNGLTEIDASSLDELSRFEPAEKPPSLEQLREYTRHRFSDRWIKYIYAKFKNECPNGRMKLAEFKRLFGAYIPDRLSDAYLERLFHAFCYTSTYADQITFKDLVTCLSRLCDEDARSNAEWTMRLINRDRTGQIIFQEFQDFVKSVFMLVGRSEQNARKLRTGSLLLGGVTAGDSGVDGAGNKKTPTVRSVAMLASAITTPSAGLAFTGTSVGGTDRAMNARAKIIFKELDMENKGYVTVENLEHYFRSKKLDHFIFF